jgi:hypothetical protein
VTWDPESPGVGGGTSNGPSLAVFNGRLYAAWKGVDGDSRMFYSSFDGNQWSPEQPGVGGGTSNGPCLAVFNGRLYAAWKGVPNDSRMFYSSYTDSPAMEFTGQIVSGGAAALGGWVQATIGPDGSVRWQGHAHDSGADGYSYSIAALIRPTAGGPIALVHQGHVGGTLTSGSRNDDWDQVQAAGSITPDHLGDFAGAHFQTNLQYTSDIGQAFESLFDWVLKASVGSLTGGAGAILFVGLEVGSLFATGSLVAGAEIAQGILWMAGPSNTLFAIIGQTVASLATRPPRQLTAQEYEWANGSGIFAGSLPPLETLLVTDALGPDQRAFTFPRFDGKTILNLGPDGWGDTRDAGGVAQGRHVSGEIFVHELVHACQIHSEQNLTWLAGALATTLCAISTDPYDYGPPTSDYLSLNIEQQAQIVSDWFAGRPHNKAAANPAQAMSPSSPYYHYVQDNVRTGHFR